MLGRKIRSIIIRHALELATKTTIDKSKIAKALVDRIVNKEHLASKRTVYYALEDERFAEYKSETRSTGIRNGKSKSKCNVALRESTSTSISEQQSEPVTTTSSLPQQYSVYTLERKPEEQLPQWILDARQAIDDSNNIQSLMGHLLQKLTGLTDAERLKISDNMEKGKKRRNWQVN